MQGQPRRDREWEHWPGRKPPDDRLRHRLRSLFVPTDGGEEAEVEALIAERDREIEERTNQLAATIADLERREEQASRLRIAVEEMLRQGSAESSLLPSCRAQRTRHGNPGSGREAGGRRARRRRAEARARRGRAPPGCRRASRDRAHRARVDTAADRRRADRARAAPRRCRAEGCGARRARGRARSSRGAADTPGGRAGGVET